MQQEPIDWRCLPYILGLFFRPIFQGIYPQFIWPEKWYVYVAPCIGSWNSHWYLETKRNIETLYKCVYNLGSCYPKIKWSWTHSPYKKKLEHLLENLQQLKWDWEMRETSESRWNSMGKKYGNIYGIARKMLGKLLLQEGNIFVWCFFIFQTITYNYLIDSSSNSDSAPARP